MDLAEGVGESAQQAGLAPGAGVGDEGGVDPADVEQVLAPVPHRRFLRARHQDARARGRAVSKDM
ncbi:hypothetical protein ACPC54_40605 [Kitasatospora sp. NPDC094028]